ncbi:MAG: Holliday junction branch migration protein RuvA [Chlorobium phaeobacteroides]|uniref:Holliday junction branch migration complex subunit RuvA n=1 Tax=Chlorobium phaeobacteroides (strain BS1) TaxID=331678 RepID=RUVA_CHLPB|nr:RecName: Full=Holliday junction branch migration complex subunit RuvA [Chlorobium phaeobacteroides BS1]MBL6955572.1 Holliday junction branch migration protein RuvA [Chlorobium phaeobacteroides]
MFTYFRGELIEASPDEAVIEVSGVGYLLSISATTYRQLPEPGREVLVLAHLHVKEDLMQLFGFLEEEERQLFRLLLSISGVGPKLALAILSGLQVHEIQEAIVSNMPERLFEITGVGKKTAARIVLELRDRILKLRPSGGTKSVSRLSESSMRDDAVNALVTLGFLRSVAQKAVTESLTSLRNPQVEDLVRDALLTIRTP